LHALANRGRRQADGGRQFGIGRPPVPLQQTDQLVIDVIESDPGDMRQRQPRV
jgi:hypothetical protein